MRSYREQTDLPFGWFAAFAEDRNGTVAGDRVIEPIVGNPRYPGFFFGFALKAFGAVDFPDSRTADPQVHPAE